MSDKNNATGLCPVNVTQNVLAGKWKLTVLWLISKKTRRFNELQRMIPGVARGVLAIQLRELERDGLVHREVYGEVPPKVEYSLTEIGESFIPVMKNIMEWGVGYIIKTSGNKIYKCVEHDYPCRDCYETAIRKAGEI